MTRDKWITESVIAATLVWATATAGCAAPQSKMQRGVETMQAESAPEQLAARGDAYAAVGDMTRAEQYFAAALRSGGESARLVRRLIAVCAADSRYPVALEYADDYLRKHPADVDVRFAAATLRVAIGDEQRARQELATVLAARPGFGDAHYTLALLEKGSGDPLAADVQFRAYLALAPNGEHGEVARDNLLRAVP